MTCDHRVTRLDLDEAIVCEQCMTVLRKPLLTRRQVGAKIMEEWERAKIEADSAIKWIDGSGDSDFADGVW